VGLVAMFMKNYVQDHIFCKIWVHLILTETTGVLGNQARLKMLQVICALTTTGLMENNFFVLG
jgi:hypothetical protein